ncbi:Mu transposase C-terminal domain-containing protein [Nonomuraea sp. NPDC052116]|uniref:Mu transposase C-terminal domain-containing protein n=1 Tax=Nonomuraea sp. NPDC052116 TaxID=3155665 RepID=UPI00342FA07A
MTVSKPPELKADDDVLVGGRRATVVAVTGSGIELEDVAGARFTVTQGALFTDPGFRIMEAPSAPLPPSGLLDSVPEEVADKARWWERHIVEVLTGLPPGGEAGSGIRAEYDPRTSSLRQRELAKLEELHSAGHEVVLRTLQRFRRRYETEGLWGLVDARFARQSSPTGRADPRVVDAVGQAVLEQTDASTGTVDRLRRRVEQILVEAGVDPAEVMPSRAGFYRVVSAVSAGKHTFGSARTRRSLAKQPDRPFGTVTAVRPGQWMQIDSSPLNIAVRLDNGLIDRVDLTWMIDLATRTIPVAVLRPSTKAVDAALLLARSLTPEPMRPGWVDALRMSRSVLPHRRLTSIDQRLADAAARPVIVPGTIVCDHGMVYMSQTFRNACRAMGINVQPTHKGSPWEKGNVETSFAAVDTLFAQYVAGYVGNSVEHRGKDADQAAVWSMIELQEMLDEWLVATWQNRPHDGLREPLFPGKALTPNEKYASLIEVAGYVPVPLSQNDYIELLPVEWRAINSYGIKIKHRKYDSRALRRYRRQHSGVAAKKGLWEVHRDPYDVSRIWVRNHRDGGWIEATWTYLNAGPVPFGDLAWEHAQRMLARRGIGKPTEEEIARAASDLLDRAERGPDRETTRQDLRVAARTRATTSQEVAEAWPRAQAETPVAEPSPPEEDADDEFDDEEEELAKVIPLGVFDAAEEAKKRW